MQISYGAGKIREHFNKGDEVLTLHALWEFCKANPYPDQKVAYLHSKGSFHDHPENARLRQFVTRGALSEECTNLPDQCNICSSRMSPHPHPHSTGNMWLARCDYVAKLMDPAVDFEKHPSYPVNFKGDWACRGQGRFFAEHWPYSHPTVKPCDLYKYEDFIWGHKYVPDPYTFELDLQIAPKRFPGGLQRGVYTRIGHCPIANIGDRIWNYEALYRERPDESWWGWEFYNQTFEESKNFQFDWSYLADVPK